MKSNQLFLGALTATLLVAGGIQAKDWDENGQKGHNDKIWCHHQEGNEALWHLLPEEKRTMLHESMEKIHKQNAALREQGHKLHEDLSVLLKGDEFDKDAYLAKKTQLDLVHDKMRKNAEKEFAEVAAKFSPEERKILAEMQNMRHHREHGYHHDGQDNPHS